MQILGLKRKHLFMATAVVVAALGWLLATEDVSVAFDFGTDTAHGNVGYGVSRLGVEEARGDCAHCHDAADPANRSAYAFMPFYDDAISACDLFCFTCHSGFETWQPVENHLYSVTFGGYPSPGPYESIYEQCCDGNSLPGACGSRHNMAQMYNGLKSPLGQSWGYNDDPDPCVACHAPHLGQRNFPPTTSGDLNTCIRLPSKYKSTAPADVLWGDDDGERMDDYAASYGGVYQPPYYGDTTSGNFEPTGTAVDYGGDRTPDYVTLCMECHQYTLYDPDRGGAAVKAIDWDFDRHGTALANTCDGTSMFEGTVRPPYVDTANSNYILSCLDCHESHGSYKRPHLLRQMINGEVVGPDTSPCDEESDYWAICARCHDCYHAEEQVVCFVCHSGTGGFHGSVMTVTGCDDEPGF